MSDNHNEFRPIPLGNIEMGYDPVGERLALFIGCGPDRRAAASPSTSGKTRLLASTHGFLPIETGSPELAGLKFQLTLTLPKE